MTFVPTNNSAFILLLIDKIFYFRYFYINQKAMVGRGQIKSYKYNLYSNHIINLISSLLGKAI